MVSPLFKKSALQSKTAFLARLPDDAQGRGHGRRKDFIQREGGAVVDFFEGSQKDFSR